MKVTQRSRRVVRFHNVLFVVLFLAALGLLAWLSTRYNYQADWTASGRNSLSEASAALLEGLAGPVAVTSYAREVPPALREHIADLVARYRRYKPDMELSFVNPDLEPQRVRELGITVDGEMVIEYAGRTERLQDFTESGLSNALQRIARGGERRLVFLAGHGERSPRSGASYDLSAWTQQLESKGIQIAEYNPATAAAIPAGTTVLVIAGPQVDLLPGELQAIEDYVARGGNLLWLAEPGAQHGLGPLAERLGLRFVEGIVVDPNVSRVGRLLFGTDDPRVALVASYPAHPLTQGFAMNTLFPIARAIELTGAGAWQAAVFLKTLDNTWAETDLAAAEITFDPQRDIAGPLNLGVALTHRPAGSGAEGEREAGAAAQRVVVIGDGDFLSNGFLGLGGNLQLGLNIVNWLSSDDELIAIPARITPDRSLDLSDAAIAVIGFGFLGGLPLLLLGSGLVIWLRRRRR